MQKKIGKLLRRYRMMNDLTQQQLADKLKTNRANLAHYESTGRLQASQFLELLGILQVPLKDVAQIVKEHKEEQANAKAMVEIRKILED
jgi:transcriptional regulator with XRE-family HTH domain